MAKTRRQRGSGSVRKRGQALYLRYRPPGQARQVEQSFPRLEGETMPAYRQRARDELIKLTQGLAARTRRAPTTRTLEALADSYLASLQPDVKARTHESYESFIRSYILPVLGSRKVSRLTTEDIRAFQQQLLHHQVAGDRTMAVSTARVTMSRLHDMLNYALDGEDSPVTARLPVLRIRDEIHALMQNVGMSPRLMPMGSAPVLRASTVPFCSKKASLGRDVAKTS